MTPALIIEQVAAEGIRLTLGTDGKIKATGDQVAVTRWLPIIQAQKPGIVAALQAAETIVIEPAAENPRPVYWERADLSIVGPGPHTCIHTRACICVHTHSRIGVDRILGNLVQSFGGV